MILRLATLRRIFLRAVPLALCLIFLLPGIASAHAILLRSDPPKDAQLDTAPSQVRMWFSEDLNPAFSTAVVVNANNKRVDKQDAHVTASDPREMDVTLTPNLPPSVYVVVWRTDSADDGHILRGSFLFTVKNPDGSIPTLNGNTIPGQNALGGGNLTGLYTGQLDGPSAFNLIMITLVEIAAIFWVAGHLWTMFVLQLAPQNEPEQQRINWQVQQRFERGWSLPTLLMLLLANVGVLVGQALTLTGGQWAATFAPSLLIGLASSGRFGTYWLMRESVIAVAMVVAIYMLLSPNRPRQVNSLLPSVNLLLGSLLFIAIAMSSHASAVNTNLLIYAVLADWLHLLASSLWVGGMFYIVTSYLPVLKTKSIGERAHSLTTLLPYYSPLAIIGVVLMAVTGPFSATIHLTSWLQLFSTAYGRALTVKILLIGALILISAVHVGLLRPRVAKEYKKYIYATKNLAFNQAQQVKLREGRLTRGTHLLTNFVRWEPVLGVAVLLCVGLMNVFAGTLSPTAAAQQQQQPKGATSGFTTTVKTSDNRFTLKLNVNPNTFGTNIFTVNAIDNRTGKATTDIGVSLYTTMLDMDMGTDTVNLQPNGKGGFRASGDLSMSGHWEIRIQVRTPDSTLHEAKVELYTPF